VTVRSDALLICCVVLLLAAGAWPAPSSGSDPASHVFLRVQAARAATARGDPAAPESVFSRTIYFPFDRFGIEPDYLPTLDAAASHAKQLRLGVRVIVTCEIPCAAPEREVTAKRLRAVTEALRQRGLPTACIFGEVTGGQATVSHDEDARAETRSVRVLIPTNGLRCSKA
jgi:hypothetical protein